LSFNGSGLFLINSTGQPVVADTLIEAATFNAFTADVGTGLSTCITKDGQTTISANLPMAGFRHTGVGNASADTDYLAYGQAKTIIQNDTYTWCGTAGGTADALTLTPTPAITAYAAGQKFRFKSGASANTGATTVDISGEGAIAIQLNGAALAAGDIEISQWYEITLSDASTAQLLKVGIPAKVLVDGDIGVSVQAYDALLASLAGQTVAANKVQAYSGADTASLLDFKDEDDMASDSATAIPSQQSTKAYADRKFVRQTAVVASGTPLLIDFTSIPSWVKAVWIDFSAFSFNSTADLLVQVGDSGGAENSGYVSAAINGGSGASSSSTAGFVVRLAGAANLLSGHMILTNPTGNVWVSSHSGKISTGAGSQGGGDKTLTDTLTQVRVTSTSGTDTIDDGSTVNLYYMG